MRLHAWLYFLLLIYEREGKMNMSKEQTPWVLLDIAGIIYAMSCEFVLSLGQLQKVTALPLAPDVIRGVMDFRGKSIELIDTRKLLNLKSSEEEINDFCEMMNARYNDHLNWITNLENSVLNNTKFTLTTDPHKCAFGKWYDNYKPSNTQMKFMLAKFDAPHKAVHRLGVTVEELIKNNDTETAISLINSVKDTDLKQMVHLFDDVKEGYRQSRCESFLVLGDENHALAITADEILSIENIGEIDQDLLQETMTQSDCLLGVGKRKDGSSVFLFHDEHILNTFSSRKLSVV